MNETDFTALYSVAVTNSAGSRVFNMTLVQAEVVASTTTTDVISSGEGQGNSTLAAGADVEVPLAIYIFTVVDINILIILRAVPTLSVWWSV